jgi:hypothetical protein
MPDLNDQGREVREPLSDWLEKRGKQPTIADLRYYEERLEKVEAALVAYEKPLTDEMGLPRRGPGCLDNRNLTRNPIAPRPSLTKNEQSVARDRKTNPAAAREEPRGEPVEAAIEAVAEAAYLILPPQDQLLPWKKMGKSSKDPWRAKAREFYALFAALAAREEPEYRAEEDDEPARLPAREEPRDRRFHTHAEGVPCYPGCRAYAEQEER